MCLGLVKLVRHIWSLVADQGSQLKLGHLPLEQHESGVPDTMKQAPMMASSRNVIDDAVMTLLQASTTSVLPRSDLLTFKAPSGRNIIGPP